MLTEGAQDKLDARLETRLPSPLEVGAGTAIFLEGRCSHPTRDIKKLEVVIGSTRTRVSAKRMPRPGTVSQGDWWWTFVDIDRIDERKTEDVSLCAHFRRGHFEEMSIGTLELVPRLSVDVRQSSVGDRAKASVAVCMATYNPPPKLFREQIESLRAQTHQDWICLISDDSSSPSALAHIEQVIGADTRFFVSRSETRAGFYRNFGRALSMCPSHVTHVALCDQDDRWYPDKLERLIGALEPGSRLVYSDARLVDESGNVISETYWRERRNNYKNFTSLLLANTITGAASLFSADLLPYVLPFPPPQGNIYHDHWIATVAMALGSISYVGEPLYEYVQHDTAVVGHARANSGAHRRAGRTAIRGRARQRSRNWRSFYFGANCRIALFSRVLEMRCAEQLAPRRHRPVRRMTKVAHSPALLPWLMVRAGRERLGWNETAGREKALAKGLAWRILAPVRARSRSARDVGHEQPRAPLVRPAHSDALWLTPLLVDYFARDGSTLLMRLLGTSPEIVLDERYPFETKYFAYLWRWSRLLERPEWPREDWKLSNLASLDQEVDSMMLGPPPWLPRNLFDERGSGSISHACFAAAWSEFSRRAVRASTGERSAEPRYYAEKHLNTWKIDLSDLPDLRLIVLLRDPRDTFVSIKTFAERRGADFGRARASSDQEYLESIMLRQKRRLEWIEQLLQEGQVPVVRYEDLVNDLDGTAKRLEDILSVELDPQAARSDRELQKRHATTRSPQSSIGRWRAELSEEEVHAFEKALGDQIKRLGFQP